MSLSWPPPKKETGRHAGNAAARKTDSAGNGNAKPTADARQFQGITNARHPGQRAPRWDRPAEADALTALETAFSQGPTRYSVICTKTTTGVRVVFQRYASQAEAEAVAAQLRSVGCPADVEAQR